MKKYLIANEGCDDTTKTLIELSDEELKTILKFIEANNKSSTYGCHPTIYIYDKYDIDEDGYIRYWDYEPLNKVEDYE